MNSISENEKNKIVEVLKQRNALGDCPRCKHKAFTLLDGYFNQSLQQEVTGNVVIGGSTVPSVVVVCNNCGYMSQHALGALGLLPPSAGGKVD